MTFFVIFASAAGFLFCVAAVVAIYCDTRDRDWIGVAILAVPLPFIAALCVYSVVAYFAA